MHFGYISNTGGENIIATTKIRNSYDAIQSFAIQSFISNIAIVTVYSIYYLHVKGFVDV